MPLDVKLIDLYQYILKRILYSAIHKMHAVAEIVLRQITLILILFTIKIEWTLCFIGFCIFLEMVHPWTEMFYHIIWIPARELINHLCMLVVLSWAMYLLFTWTYLSEMEGTCNLEPE